MERGGTFWRRGGVTGGVIGSEAVDETGREVHHPAALDFDALVGPLIQPGFRLALLMLDDPAEAEDAVQEAAVKAWRKLHTLREGVRPWFLAIVANECRSARRRRWFSVIRKEDVEVHASWQDPADNDDLRRAVRSLSREHREVIALRYYLDLPLDEVAETVGMPLGTAKSRLHRAVAALRQAMGEEGA